MSAELATNEYTPAQIDLIKRTICDGASNDELALFIQQCKRTGLDPFARQIHAVKRWDKAKGCYTMSIQTGIDGYRLIAERTGNYAGNDDPQYDQEDKEHPNKATVTVWKVVNGQRVPFTRSARWNEFVQTTKDGRVTQFWQKMPYLMLGKVAEALALRAAFPQELSGIYTAEEMGQADNGHDAAEVVHPPVAAIPAKPADVDLVNTLEKTLRGCRSKIELKDCGGLIAQNKAKLSAAGTTHLRNVYAELNAVLPEYREAEPEMETVPADEPAGQEIEF